MRVDWVLEIAPGADLTGNPDEWTWVDIGWREGGGVSALVGQADEWTTLSPGSLSATLDNRGGRFVPTNPLSPWYGRLGINTPLRLRLRHVRDDFDRTVSGGWGRSSRSTGGPGRAWSGGADYSVSAGTARHAHPTIHTLRYTTLDVALADAEVIRDVSIPVVATGASVVTGTMFRWQDQDNYYWCRVEFDVGGVVTCKITAQVDGDETELAVAVVPGLTYGAGDALRVRASVIGSRLAVKVWPASDPEPADWALTADDTALTAAGKVGEQSWVVLGNTNPTPVVISYRNWQLLVDRQLGFVPAWPVRWDPSGNDCVAQVTAKGPTTRWTQGSPPAVSVMRRSITAAAEQGQGVLAYWHGEDAAEATQAASGLAGGPPLRPIGAVEFAAIALPTGPLSPTGSEPMPDLAGGGSLVGAVPAGTSSPVAWAIQWIANWDASAFGANQDLTLLEWHTPGGTYERWRVRQTSAIVALQVIGVAPGGTETVVLEEAGFSVGPGECRVDAVQVGGNITVRRIGEGTVRSSTTIAGTLTRITAVVGNPFRQTPTNSRLGIGHLQVWDRADAPTYGRVRTASFPVSQAFYGYRGEAAHSRLARIAAEAGIPIQVDPVDTDYETPMGSQATGPTIDLFTECAEADGGELVEYGAGYRYRPRGARYRPNVDLILDFAAEDVSIGLSPTLDHQRTVNDQTYSRPNGSEGRADDEDHIRRHGRYAGSGSLNLLTDAPLAQHAGWRVRHGTLDLLRWPALGIDLIRSPHLQDAWLSCRTGSRTVAVNPPKDVVGNEIDVLIEGWSERGTRNTWTVTATCSPTAPWLIGVLDDEDQRLDTAGSTLRSDVAEDALSLAVVSAGTPWLTGDEVSHPADFPADLRLGGERVTAAAVGPAAADDFARSVSGSWGVEPVSGQGWQHLGSAASFQVTGSEAQHIHQAVNSGRLSTIDVGATDARVRVTASVSVAASGTALTAYALARYTDDANYYQARLGWIVGGAVTCSIRRRVGGVDETLDSVVVDLVHVPGTQYCVELDVAGPMLRGRVWREGDAVPNWQARATDTTLTSGTRVGVRTVVDAGSGNSMPLTYSIHGVVADNPQLVTLTARGLNGVVKSHAAGTPLNVWHPIYPGL